jgi:hypothetical protein
VVSIVDEAVALLKEIAQPAVPGESVKAVIARAARRIGFSYGRTNGVWYRLVRIDAEEMDHMRAVRAARISQGDRKQKEKIENSRIVEYRDIIERLDRIERALVSIAQDGLCARAGLARSEND